VIDRSAGLGAGLDWKTSLQELTASGYLGVPEYHVEESGPDHQKFFRASVRVGGRTYGSGSGRSKKEAEQQAAEAAWKAISIGNESGSGPAAGGVSANGAHPASDDAGPGPASVPPVPPTAEGGAEPAGG
jgi:ribonuclease-3